MRNLFICVLIIIAAGNAGCGRHGIDERLNGFFTLDYDTDKDSCNASVHFSRWHWDYDEYISKPLPTNATILLNGQEGQPADQRVKFSWTPIQPRSTVIEIVEQNKTVLRVEKQLTDIALIQRTGTWPDSASSSEDLILNWTLSDPGVVKEYRITASYRNKDGSWPIPYTEPQKGILVFKKEDLKNNSIQFVSVTLKAYYNQWIQPAEKDLSFGALNLSVQARCSHTIKIIQ